MYEKLAPWVRSVALATASTSIMLAVLIISAEEIPALKSWLKETFYHHWLGKSVLALGLFPIVGITFRLKRDALQLSTSIIIEAIVVIVSVCSIAGFFLLHILKIV